MNPEFVRNLWLEASLRRLAWAGAALALIYGAAWVLASHTQTTVWANGRWMHMSFPAVEMAGALVFVSAGLIWAPRAASRGLNEEVLGRTWAFQRTSSLSPWEMTWGKLFGATSLAWVAALTGLCALGLGVWGASGPRTAAALTLGSASLAVGVQAAALAGVLVGVRKARAEVRLYSGRLGLGGLLGFLLLAWMFSRLFPAGGPVPGLSAWTDLIGRPVRWWGRDMSRIWFVVGSAMAFAACAVAAAWRLMRLELQMRNAAWPWAAFVLLAGLYVAGFVPGDPRGGRFAVAAVVFAALAYAAAFAEPADRVRLRLWAGSMRRLDLRQAFTGTPTVVAPVVLALLAVIGAALSRTQAVTVAHPGLFLFAGFFFLVRDLGILAYFRFAPRAGGHGDFAAVAAVALTYLIGGAAARAVGGPSGQALFLPTADHEALSLMAAMAEAGVAMALAAGRIRAVQRKA